MNKYFIIGAILVFAGVIYFTGLYTYFIRTEVQEALPSPVVTSTKFQSVIASGTFGKIDLIHKGSGVSKLIDINGTKFLRLEDFSVVSGPDLYVYLAKSTTPTSDIKSLGDYIDLGRLKGTSGNQNYETNQNIDGYKTTVIWCKRYGVLFTYAVMK